MIEVPSYEIARWLGRTTRYGLAIPVINEGDRIHRLLARMTKLSLAEQIDIVIVDGGSTDGSLAESVLNEAKVRGLIVKKGPGKLSAQLRCAYAFLLDQGYEGIVTIDGNDKDDPDAIPAFIGALNDGYDFVQASRYIPGGIESHTPLKRRIAIRWNSCAHARLGVRLRLDRYDTGLSRLFPPNADRSAHRHFSKHLRALRAARLSKLPRAATWLSLHRIADREALP